ncbi:SRPBCC family protein [Piscibacillus sp. B03]|uniref:SRPBCC family protein n=1 Tax=Piscibacillus sp. B03 TaxID=3457430 RepID=UPI003FCDB552
MGSQVELTHTFNAPCDLVFKAFTDSEHLQNWWGPEGWVFQVAKADFRPGGVFHYSQKPVDGDVMWVKFEYDEIIVPEKLIYTSYFSDEEGNVVRAPFDENWPMKIQNAYKFEELDGKTIITMVAKPVSATEEELENFKLSQKMFKEGFSVTFTQLEDYMSTKSM